MKRIYEKNLNKKDFIVRNYNKNIKIFSLMLTFIYFIMCLTLFGLEIREWLAYAVITISYLFAAISTILYVKKIYDSCTMLEFQNALFMSSLRTENEFFFILDPDGHPFYIDNAIYDFFKQDKDMKQDLIGNILQNIEIIDADQEDIYRNLEHKNDVKFLYKKSISSKMIKNQFTEYSTATDQRIYKLEFEILPKPAGFLLVRSPKDFFAKELKDRLNSDL